MQDIHPPFKKEVVIVGPMSPDAATVQFTEWRAQHPEIISQLGHEDLIRDIVRGPEGRTLHQYRIFVSV